MNEHFASFPENSLNGGVGYNEQISPVTWHLVKSRFHCILFQNITPRLYGQKCKFFATRFVSQFPEEA